MSHNLQLRGGNMDPLVCLSVPVSVHASVAVCVSLSVLVSVSVSAYGLYTNV